MREAHDAMARLGHGFVPAQDRWDRLLRRAARRQRNRRIGSAVVALALFAGTDLALLRGFAPAHDQPSPAGNPGQFQLPTPAGGVGGPNSASGSSHHSVAPPSIRGQSPAYYFNGQDGQDQTSGQPSGGGANNDGSTGSSADGSGQGSPSGGTSAGTTPTPGGSGAPPGSGNGSGAGGSGGGPPDPSPAPPPCVSGSQSPGAHVAGGAAPSPGDPCPVVDPPPAGGPPPASVPGMTRA